MSFNGQTKLSIVTSIYRTGTELPEFYKACIDVIRKLGIDYEFIMVNDASPDHALLAAKALAAADPRVIVIDLSRNYGQHKALWVGMKHATGNLIAILDSDLEDDPQWLVTFKAKLEELDADVIYGIRTQPKGNAVYRSSRNLFFLLLDSLTGQRFPRNVTAARLMTRRYLNALLSFEEKEIFLLGLWHTAGFKQIGVPIVRRHHSATSYKFTKLVSLFIHGVTSFSVSPLIAIFSIGITISFLSLVFIIYLFIKKLFFGIAVEGWTSVMAVILVLGGAILFANGIIAIYIGTIFLEVKHRPTIIREIIGADANGASQPHD